MSSEPLKRERPEGDQELFRCAAEWKPEISLGDLDAGLLRQLTVEGGRDFAAAVLFDRLMKSPHHGPFIQWMNRRSVGPADPGSSTVSASAASNSLRPRVVVVPGSFYKEKKDASSGQFILDVARSRGFRTDRIPVQSFGTVTAGARCILEWLQAQPAGPIVIFSISKGSAEIRHALRDPTAPLAFRNVTTWISLSGMPTGTLLANWFVRQRVLWIVRLVFWHLGYSYAAIDELRHGEGSLLAGDFAQPVGMRVVHVVAFPLQSKSNAGPLRAANATMNTFGPHDGVGVALADLVRWPGLVYPIWGADHAIGKAWNVTRLIPRLLEYAEQPAEAPAPA